MRHNSKYRVFALIMAFLMFFASVGFSIDFHYCKGELKSFSIIGEASTCHSSKKSCPRHAENQIQEKNDDSKCCSNETLVVEDLDSDYNLVSDLELTDLQVKVITAFVFSFGDLLLPKVSKSTILKTDIQLPPRDIYVLLERFLI